MSNNVFSDSLLFSESNENHLNEYLTNKLSDTVITEKIYSTLLLAHNINSESLSIRTDLSHVTVTGFVNNAGEELQIIKVIKTVDNVKSIDSNVNIK
ncbi:BON domain-containing protein [Proteus faecis]|uniref:BON domain-containing protein n=1 Tax=Proteus faecis TaxID=2050967 RepID=UPI003CF3583F